MKVDNKISCPLVTLKEHTQIPGILCWTESLRFMIPTLGFFTICNGFLIDDERDRNNKIVLPLDNLF